MSKKDKGKNSKDKAGNNADTTSKNTDEVEAELELDKKKPMKAVAGEKTIAVDKKTYTSELRRLQVELVKLQEWVRIKGLKVVVIF
jgi:polyphosphate kinase 2 (PPK2 family)